MEHRGRAVHFGFCGFTSLVTHTIFWKIIVVSVILLRKNPTHMWSWLWWTKEVAWPARFRWRSFEVRYCQVSCTPENWVVVWFFCDPYLGKWSNSTNIFQMGWSHQLDYVQSIHVLLWMILSLSLSLSLSPAPSPWFWSLDFQNCHRGSGIGVVTCLKYHDIMTKSWKSHTLIPMLTPGCSRLANLQYITTWPGEALKSRPGGETIATSCTKSWGCSPSTWGIPAEVLRFCCYFQKVTGCRG